MVYATQRWAWLIRFLLRLLIWSRTVSTRVGVGRTDGTASGQGSGAHFRSFVPQTGANLSARASLLLGPALRAPAWLLTRVIHTIDQLPVQGNEWQNDLLLAGLIALAILVGALVIVGLALCHARRVARQYEVALRASEERYRLITEQARDLIVVVDHQGYVHDASPSFRPMLGYEPARLIGQVLFRSIHPDDIAETTARLAAAFTHGTGQAIVRLRHADGAWRWIEAQIFSLLDTGRPTALIVGQDITERRRLEAELYHAHKLHSLGRLTSGVVHDVNNLLTGIAGFAELALYTLPPGQASRQDLEAIRETAARAAALADTLLAFVRNQPIASRRIDLNDLVRNLERLLRQLLGVDIELISLIAPALGSVKADSSQIEQVLVNLAINARDAMPQGGTLTIAAATVTLKAGQSHAHADCVPGEYVLLTVSDTGTGIDATTQARLFEPFFTTKSPEHGTGLGLAICQRIIRQYGGNIRIASAPGQGTTVSVYLPLVGPIDTPAPAMPPSWTAELPRGIETVLVVEDEAIVRTLAARVLRDLGYTVLEASDGAEALHLIATCCGPLHIVLTDVLLPRIDGKTLAERLVARYPDVHVIFMSGTAASDYSWAQQLDHDALVLHKPFSCAELASLVRKALDDQRASF